MRVQRSTDVTAFAERVSPFLLASEAEHCLQLGLLATLPATIGDFSGPPYLACLEDDGGEIALVALRTPPYNLVFSQFARGANVELALSILAHDAFVATVGAPVVLALDTIAKPISEPGSLAAHGAWNNASH